MARYKMFWSLFFTGLAGGFMVLCWAAYSGFLKDLFKGAFGWRKREQPRDPEQVDSNPLKRKMPYAPAIAIGTLISFFAR